MGRLILKPAAGTGAPPERATPFSLHTASEPGTSAQVHRGRWESPAASRKGMYAFVSATPSPPPEVAALPASPFAWNQHLYGSSVPAYTFAAFNDSGDMLVVLASPGTAPPLTRTSEDLPPAAATYPADLLDVARAHGLARLEPGALWDFCAASRSNDRVPYHGLAQVRCGETVVYSRRARGWEVQSETFAPPPPVPPGTMRTEDDAVEACRAVIDNYLERALRFTPDPIGLTLSAGFDSTLVLDRLVHGAGPRSVRAYTHVPTRIDPACRMGENGLEHPRALRTAASAGVRATPVETPVRERLHELADQYYDSTGWYPVAPHLLDWIRDLHEHAAPECRVMCNAHAGNFTTSYAPGPRYGRALKLARRCVTPHRSLPDLRDAIAHGEPLSNLLGPRWPFFATPPEFGYRVSAQWYSETAGIGVLDPLASAELAALVRTLPRTLFRGRTLGRALLKDRFQEVATRPHLQAQCVDALTRFAAGRTDWRQRWRNRAGQPLVSRLWRLREAAAVIDRFPAQGTPCGYVGRYFTTAFWRAEAVAVLVERCGLDTAAARPGVVF